MGREDLLRIGFSIRAKDLLLLVRSATARAIEARHIVRIISLKNSYIYQIEQICNISINTKL